jgi:hypothetical protein
VIGAVVHRHTRSCVVDAPVPLADDAHGRRLPVPPCDDRGLLLDDVEQSRHVAGPRHHLVVAFEQHQRERPRRDRPRRRDLGALDVRGDTRDRGLDVGAVPRARGDRTRGGGSTYRDVDEPVEADAADGDRRNDGHAEQPAELDVVDAQPLSPCLVDEVEREHDRHAEVQQLQREIEVALQPRGVDNHDHDVGAAVEQRAACHPLILGRPAQRVRARQVHHAELASPEHRARELHLDRLAGIVGGLDAHPGEPVEDARLADVGIAGEGDADTGTALPAGDRGMAGGHYVSWTTIRAATSRPSA